MFILQRANTLFGHFSSGTSILPLANKIEAPIKLKPPTSIKEGLGLRGYYQRLICNYTDIPYPLNCLTHKVQPFIWIPEYQTSFDMLWLRLTNTPIVHSLDINKPYLLFMDASKFCDSGIFTQTSTKQSNEAVIRILTNETPLTSVESQTQELQLKSNVIHPVAYISGSFSQSQCRWPVITKECFSVFMPIQSAHSTYKMLIYMYNQITNTTQNFYWTH